MAIGPVTACLQYLRTPVRSLRTMALAVSIFAGFSFIGSAGAMDPDYLAGQDIGNAFAAPEYSPEEEGGYQLDVQKLSEVARHVGQKQAGAGGSFDQGYSLAEAMADALWRKQVVDSLYRDKTEDE